MDKITYIHIPCAGNRRLERRLAVLPLSWVALELLGERCGPRERLGHQKAYRINAASIASTVSNLKSLPAAFGISRPTRMPYPPAKADISGPIRVEAGLAAREPTSPIPRLRLDAADRGIPRAPPRPATYPCPCLADHPFPGTFQFRDT